MDLLGNAAIDLRRTSATYSTKVSRDIDQSQHPCMSRAGKRGIRRKSGHDIDGSRHPFMSRAWKRVGRQRIVR